MPRQRCDTRATMPIAARAAHVLDILVAAEFASNILNPRADPCHSRCNFIFGHIEPFGPVPEFVIFMRIDELGIGPSLLCHRTYQPSDAGIPAFGPSIRTPVNLLAVDVRPHCPPNSRFDSPDALFKFRRDKHQQAKARSRWPLWRRQYHGVKARGLSNPPPCFAFVSMLTKL